MKRKYGDRRNWQRILASRFSVMPLQEAELSGVALLYQIDAVREPLWVTSAGRRICVADAGYTWLQYYPLAPVDATELVGVEQTGGACYTMTAMFDMAGQIVQWYVDICSATGIDDAGVPWHDDLYLDIVYDPNTGNQEVIDVEELDDALTQGNVSVAAYHAAWRETHRLAPLVAQGARPEMRLAATHRALLLDRLARA